jgi:type IV pilus assembly protein PilN
MARINLLPWREERRKQRQVQFNITAGVVAGIGLVTVGLMYGGMDGLIAGQNQRNAFLTDQIAQMDKKIETIKSLQEQKQRLIARMQIIEQLQQSRPTEVHLLDEIVKTLPPGVYLTGLTQTGDQLSINGVAESSARVSTYLRNLDTSLWVGQPNLQIVQKDPAKSGAQSFTITAKVLNGSDKKAKAAGDDAGDAS